MPNDDAAIATTITPETAVVVLEPIQGEGGVRPLTPAFARAVQDACDRTGTLLICDEVQSGLGRTGVGFAFRSWGCGLRLSRSGRHSAPASQSAPRWSARTSHRA